MLKSFVCAIALAATASVASAESISVATSDLDLSSAAGQKKLDQRINMAARKICGASEPNTGTRVAPRASTECVRRTVSETRAKLASTVPQKAG